MTRRAAAKIRRWPKVLAWAAGGLLVALVAAYFAGQAWLNRYLRSAEFRAKLEDGASAGLRARVQIAPIQFEGTRFFCDRLTAEGAEEAGFSAANVEAIRGDVDLPSVFKLVFGERRVRVDHVEIQKLALDFYRDRVAMELPPRPERGHDDTLGAITIRDLTVGWPMGGIKGALVRAKHVDGGWRIEGEGGRLTQLGMPSIELKSVRLVAKGRSLFVQDALLAQDGGELGVSGEVTGGEKADLLFTLRDINVTPLLPEDWRARLHGRLGGEVRLAMPLHDHEAGPPVVSGRLELRNGVLEALPVLSRIAEFTRMDQFLRVPLHRLTADFRHQQDGLHVSNLVLESKQLIVVKGSFKVAEGRVDGTFDVGVTPGSLQWIPGSQDKVFNTPGAGYAWTKMRVVGPLDELQEDLTPRLVAAAKDAAVEKVTTTADEAVQKVRDTANGAVGTTLDAVKKAAGTLLSPLFGP